MGERKRVLQLGGVSGVLAGLLLFLVVGTTLGLSVGEGGTGSLSYSALFGGILGSVILAAAILAIPLYLALAHSLRELSLVFAPFGGAWGAVGLVLLGLSSAYGFGWALVGIPFVAVSFLVLGAVMWGSPNFEGVAIGGVSVFLGVVALFAVSYSWVDPVGLVTALLTLAAVFTLFGWRAYRLSRGSEERGEVAPVTKGWPTQPGAIRVLAVSLFLVGAAYIAFTVYVFLYEAVGGAGLAQGSWGPWNLAYSLILAVFGITYIAVALNLPQRTTGDWQRALVASVLASLLSVLLSASWLGYVGSLWAIPVALALPPLVVYGVAPAVPASLIGARRHFDIGAERTT